jgi:hypothetical protein
VSLNDELLKLDQKISYYTVETFRSVPSESGVYAWFYPLRFVGLDLKKFINEVNFVFNFCSKNNDISTSEFYPKKNFSLGWKNYTLESKFNDLSEESDIVKKWQNILERNSWDDESPEVVEIKNIIFISSVFMTPLYVGKTENLHNRCYQHIFGNSSDKNIFHSRFKNHAHLKEDSSCKEVEDLIFACISTKKFGLDGNNYEKLIEGIIMNLVKPIYSVK